MKAWPAVLLLATLAAGCSPSRLSNPPSPTEKPVSYGGLTVEVPSIWPVYQRSKEFCGISGPGVLVGPPPPSSIHVFCPLIIRRGVVLTFGGPDRIVPAGPERKETIHGVEVKVSKASFEDGTLNGVPQWTSEEVARFPGHNVWLRAYAPGRESAGVLSVVDKVVDTVRLG